MKKITLVLAFSLVAYINLKAQEERKGFIGITYGINIPLGDYSNTDGKNKSAGYAINGNFLELVKFGYRFGSNFGIAGSWYGLANPMDAQAVATELGKQMPVGTSGSVQAKPWAAGGLLFGPLYTINQGKINFDFSLLLGYAGASTPETEIVINSGSSTSTLNYESKLEMGFAYKIGGDVRYKLGGKWALAAGLSYFSSTIDYSGIKVTDNNGKTTTGGSFSQPINTLNTTLSLLYLLK